MVVQRFLLVLLVFTNSLLWSQTSYEQKVQADRDEFETTLLHTDKVLNEEEKLTIQKLNYFPVDSSWVLTAKFKKKIGKNFQMPTTTERKPLYRRIGYLHFKKGKKRFKLTVYKNLELNDPAYKDYVFVPFRDANSPKTTYGGGRYLDLEMKITDKRVVVDFNKAYNPYCVYSYRYSCPVTPTENHLKVKIDAGVQNPTITED